MSSSRSLHAYLQPDACPDRSALQSAIRELGFRLVIEGDFHCDQAPAYLPCTLEGEDAGVDLRFEPMAELPDCAAALRPHQGSRSLRVVLQWGGDAREEIAATVIAAALAERFDALVLSPDRGVRKSVSGLKAHARERAEGTF